MKGDTLLVIILVLAFVGFAGIIAILTMTEDDTEWVQLENPNCVLRVDKERNLTAPDVTTRTTYCRETK